MKPKWLIPSLPPQIHSSSCVVNVHVDHYEDDGVKNYPQSDFPKQMFIEFAETWVGK